MTFSNYLFIITLLSGSIVTVSAADTAASTVTQPASTSTTDPYLPNTEFVKQSCPDPSQLTRGEDLIWQAPGGWKSYGESFSSEIDHFSGAQWQGVNLGKVICVYIGKGRKTFPVTLERELIVTEPITSDWRKQRGGYKNCDSTNVKDCTFSVEKPRKVKNVYDEINFYKGQKDVTD